MGELYTEIPVEVVLGAAGLVSLLFLIVVIVLWVKVNRLRKRYVQMLNGAAEADVEAILLQLQEQLNERAAHDQETDRQLGSIQQRMKQMKSHIAVYRYNAFQEGGNDLSFSVAILDDEQSGVVFSGIHNREQTYVYAKPIAEGGSKYPLSPEEKEAISRCLPGKS